MKSKVFEAQFLNIDCTVWATFDIVSYQVDNKNGFVDVLATKHTYQVIVDYEAFIFKEASVFHVWPY